MTPWDEGAKSVISQVEDSTVGVITRLMDELSARYGDAAAQMLARMWAVCVKEQVIEGWLWAIGFGVVTGIAILAAYIVSRFRLEDWGDPDPPIGLCVSAIIGAIALGIMLVFSIGFLFRGLPRLLNPEFFAMNHFVDMLRTAVEATK